MTGVQTCALPIFRTLTVGTRISLAHARLRSWALPPIGNFTLPRRLAAECSAAKNIKLLGLDNAIDRANILAAWGIVMANALYTGVRVDHINVTISDGLGGTFG